MSGGLQSAIDREAREWGERRAIARRQGIDTPVPSRRGETVPQPGAGPLPVYRDPCFRCGTRGDVGCRHQQRSTESRDHGLRSSADTDRRHGHHLLVRAGKSLRLWRPSAVSLRLEGQHTPQRHLRRPDLRELRDIAGIGKASLPPARGRIPTVESTSGGAHVSEHPISIEMLEEGHLLLLGTTGAGKTYQQRGFLERLRFNGRRVGAVDKLGNHWGLTLSADGQGAGLDFVIFGGKRAHVPMTPFDGELVGRLFVERNIPAIFDVSQWKADEQLDWMEGFADAVFLHNDGPLHLGLDEAQSWVPQGGGGDAFNSVRRLAEQGRGNGIRLMMAAQRLSRIDKSCAGMAAVVVAMRQTGTADRKAMRDLLAADTEQMAMIERELPGLPTGTGFVWDPLQGSLVRHAFPANMTFDSSRTPRHGDAPPATIAVSSDLVDELREALAPAPAAEDPKEALAKGGAIGAERDAQIADLEAAYDLMERTAIEASQARDELYARHQRDLSLITAGIDAAIGDLRRLRARLDRKGAPESAIAPVRIPNTAIGVVPERELRSLGVLASIYPGGLSEAAWAGRAGRARKGGAWASQRKRYADARLIEKRDGRWFATQEGVIAAAGEVPSLPPPGADLVSWWAERLGASGKLLRYLYGMHGLTRGELAAAVNMTVTGGAFSGAVAELKRNELIEERGKRLFVAPALTGEQQ